MVALLEKNMTTEIDNLESLKVSISRRNLLKWTTPTVAFVTLPAHAQTTEVEPPMPEPEPQQCGSSPVLLAQEASKCVGSAPVLGDIILTLASDGADPEYLEIDILSVTHNAGEEHSLTLSLSSLPATISDTGGIEIGWVGEASDLQTCLPTPDVTISVDYACGGSETSQMEFSLLTTVSSVTP